jgi:hypothetical protein
VATIRDAVSNNTRHRIYRDRSRRLRLSFVSEVVGAIPRFVHAAAFWLPVGFAPLAFCPVLMSAPWLRWSPWLRLLVSIALALAMYVGFIAFYGAWGEGRPGMVGRWGHILGCGRGCGCSDRAGECRRGSCRRMELSRCCRCGASWQC